MALANLVQGLVRPSRRDTRPKASSDIVKRTVSGETLLVPVKGPVADCDRIFILNATGTFLWPLLDGTRSGQELARLLCEAFDGSTAAAASADVERFLESLDERRLIEWEQS